MRKLHRSKTNYVILGICGGLGEYFDIDPNMIRIIFIVLAFAGGISIILYLVLALLIPKEQQKLVNFQELEEDAREFIGKILGRETVEGDELKKNSLGLIICLVGLYVLLYNLNLLSSVNYLILWPLFFILLGIIIFIRGKVNVNLLILILLVLLIFSIILSNSLLRVF